MEPINSELFCELNTINMILIPLLSFDRKGNRVGYGYGYYDKFLSKCNNAKKLAYHLKNL